MKRIVILFTFLSLAGSAQKKTYFTSGLEMIFSWANINDNSKVESSSIRWAPVINIQSMWNTDLNPHFGLFSGLAIRNVGYIYPNYKMPIPAGSTNTVVTTVEKRFRSYNLGIPIGFKIGNLKKMFIYAGYEFELPILYKEKKYEGGDKTQKITGWFSSRQQSFYHSVMVGIQFPYGMNVKFKYYLTEFHNQNYTDSDGTKPYAGLKSNVFFVSLSSYLFTDAEFSTHSPE